MRVWQLAEQNCVHDTEHGRVRTDAKSECKDGNGSKAWTLAKHSCAITRILKQSVENVDAARFPAFLLNSLNSAQLHAGTPNRFFTRYSAADQVLGESFQMETKLRV